MPYYLGDPLGPWSELASIASAAFNVIDAQKSQKLAQQNQALQNATAQAEYGFTYDPKTGQYTQPPSVFGAQPSAPSPTAPGQQAPAQGPAQPPSPGAYKPGPGLGSFSPEQSASVASASQPAGSGGMFGSNPYPVNTPDFWGHEADTAEQMALGLAPKSADATKLTGYAAFARNRESEEQRRAEYSWVPSDPNNPKSPPMLVSNNELRRESVVPKSEIYRQGQENQRFEAGRQYVPGMGWVPSGSIYSAAAAAERQKSAQANAWGMLGAREAFQQRQDEWKWRHPSLVAVWNQSDKSPTVALHLANQGILADVKAMQSISKDWGDKNGNPNTAGQFPHNAEAQDFINKARKAIDSNPKAGEQFEAAINQFPEGGGRGQLTHDEKAELLRLIHDYDSDKAAAKIAQGQLDQNKKQAMQGYSFPGGSDDDLNPPLDWEDGSP